MLGASAPGFGFDLGFGRWGRCIHLVVAFGHHNSSEGGGPAARAVALRLTSDSGGIQSEKKTQPKSVRDQICSVRSVASIGSRSFGCTRQFTHMPRARVGHARTAAGSATPTDHFTRSQGTCL